VARTKEPVREGIVAGLEPFIDTIVVCTFTALIILSTGIWNRAAESTYSVTPQVVPGEKLGVWTVETGSLPTLKNTNDSFSNGGAVYMFLEGDANGDAGNNLHQLSGTVVNDNGLQTIRWDTVKSDKQPRVRDGEVFKNIQAATMTAKAFDSVTPGVGMWLVTIASWLFAISTMISWSYYGEQGIIYLLGEKAILPYKFIYCLLIIIATTGFIQTTTQLDNFTNLGTGVMLWANIPITLFFGYQAMKAYKNCRRRS